MLWFGNTKIYQIKGIFSLYSSCFMLDSWSVRLINKLVMFLFGLFIVLIKDKHTQFKRQFDFTIKQLNSMKSLSNEFSSGTERSRHAQADQDYYWMYGVQWITVIQSWTLLLIQCTVQICSSRWTRGSSLCFCCCSLKVQSVCVTVCVTDPTKMCSNIVLMLPLSYEKVISECSPFLHVFKKFFSWLCER